MGNSKKARKFQVTIIGSSDSTDEQYKTAYEIASYIAKKGWVLINGGRTGVMEASSKGVYENNGISVAILPYDSIDSGNRYSTISIPTTIGFARNCITVASADCVVIVGGKSGTLCELTFAWQYNKKIISCAWIEGVSKDYAGKKLDDKREDPILKADNLNGVFKLLEIEYMNFKKNNI